MKEKHRVELEYCRQCGWLLRTAWMVQELLSSFPEEIGEAVLRPGTGGVFRVKVDDQLVWDRERDGGFPEIRILKQKVRDIVDPGRDLGHIDRGKPTGEK